MMILPDRLLFSGKTTKFADCLEIIYKLYCNEKENCCRKLENEHHRSGRR